MTVRKPKKTFELMFDSTVLTLLFELLHLFSVIFLEDAHVFYTLMLELLLRFIVKKLEFSLCYFSYLQKLFSSDLPLFYYTTFVIR